MSFRFFTFCCLLVVLTACSSESDSTNKTPPAPAAAPPSSAISSTAPTGSPRYPGISTEEMQNLWDKTTAIDYIFYKLPISMSMTEKPAIQNILRQIANQPGLIDDSCKAMGRVFFQENGNPLAEADFFFSPGCTYFVFHEDQKPVKANQMTPEGITFFQQLLDNASQGQ